MSRISDRIATSTTQAIDEQHSVLPNISTERSSANDSITNVKSLIDSRLAKETLAPLDQAIKDTLHHHKSSISAANESGEQSGIALSAKSNHTIITAMSNVTTMNVIGNITEQTTGLPDPSGNHSSDPMNDWFHMPKVDNFMDIFTLSCSAAVILGGLVPYIPQYLKIKRSGSSDGFSTYVCLTLLLANILRIAFWFGHRFGLPLLYQSFFMIAGMLAMMEICIRVRNRNGPYIIGLRPKTARPRRSIIVTSGSASSSSSSSPTSSGAIVAAPLLPEPKGSHSGSRTQVPYHQQDSIEIECERNSDSMSRAEPSTQYSSNSTDSFSDLESPILSNIQAPTTSSRETQQQDNGHESQLVDHSFSNGYISNQRKHKLGLVKWLSASNFWDWDDYLSYVKFLTLFTVILGLMTYLLLDNHVYIETLGFVALFTESMLGIPQLVRNYTKKSTRGMSVEMVVMWLSGDLFKTLYFILGHEPVQFIVCGTLQVFVDVLILSQVLWYRRPKATYSKLPKSN